MSKVLINSLDGVTLVGGGPVTLAALDAALALAPRLVAADGGADAAQALGHQPTAIIGDFDSIANLEYWQKSDTDVYPVDGQETTDFEKCLHAVAAPLILGVGFLGGRLDHGLAALSALVAEGARPILLLGEQEVVFHCPKGLAIDLPMGTVASLFPMRPVLGLHSVGLEWSIKGLAMAPGGRVGTSNRMSGARLEMAFDGPGMLVILPLEALSAIVAVNTLEH